MQEQFYAAINRVKPSLIRVEADELTYNLHIMLRFEIEQDLIEGRTRPEDLPGIWNQKMKDYLGVVPSNDAEGVLQDVHWSFGAFGYFPTYTLGNLYAVQFYEQAKLEIPHLEDEIAAGQLMVCSVGSDKRFIAGEDVHAGSPRPTSDGKEPRP
jgi:Zn-dependent carboxypeptidase